MERVRPAKRKRLPGAVRKVPKRGVGQSAFFVTEA
jgi:hypothetical protein